MSLSWQLLVGSLCVTLWLAPGSWARSRAPRSQIIFADAWGQTSCIDRAGVVPLWHASAAVTWVHAAVRAKDYGLQPRMKMLALTVTAQRGCNARSRWALERRMLDVLSGLCKITRWSFLSSEAMLAARSSATQ